MPVEVFYFFLKKEKAGHYKNEPAFNFSILPAFPE